MRLPSVALVGLAWLCGCGDETTTPEPDASTTDADVGTTEWATPDPPALPVLTPCADGWAEISTGGGPTICAPFPDDEPDRCADHEAHFPGTGGCARVGTSCASDGWPAGAPSTGVIFVRAGALSGDGTRAAPFGTITDATAGATRGDVIAVGTGTYEEEVLLPEGVTLLGACPESTIVRSPVASLTGGVIEAAGPDVTVENVSVGPSARPGLFARGADRSMTARDVVVVEPEGAGISIENEARFQGERLVVRRVQPAAGRFGYGVNAESGGALTIRGLVVDASSEAGIVSNLAGSDVTIEDAVVHDVVGLPSGERGQGIIVNAGASLVARRTVVLRTKDVGVLASGDGSALTLEDSSVLDTESAGMRLDLGRGIVVQDGADAVLRRARVQRAYTTGIVVEGGAHATGGDLVIHDIRRLGSPRGAGLVVQEATFEGERLDVRRVFQIGVAVSAAATASPAQATISDLRVADVLHEETFSRALTAQHGEVTLLRAELSGAAESGLSGVGGSRVVAESVFVHDISSRPEDGAAGYGVVAYLDSSVLLRNAVIEDVQQAGAIAFGDASTLELEGIEVRRVAPPSCVGGDACRFGDSGHAIAVYSSSHVRADHFLLSTPSLCGIHIAESGTATLSDGEIRGAEIGACVQNDSQPIEDLQGGVRYVDNGMNLQATMLPVPTGLPGSP